MKAPRFFLSAVVLFWGWQTNLLWIAICLGIILEYSDIVKSKFDFKIADFNKFIDISTIFLAGTIVLALSIEAKEAIFILLKWIPLILFPVMAAQSFSSNGKIDIQSFFLVSRRKKKRNENHHSKTIDFSYIYALFSIVSAGTANSEGLIYFFSIVIFFIWALWSVRSKHIPSFFWIICILITIITGFAGHKGMRMASIKMSQLMMEYYSNYYNMNPFRTFTALGSITKLKLSNKIIFRASFEDYTPGKTYLLQNAIYNKFLVSHWFIKSGFEKVEHAKENTFWQINPPVKNTKKMTAYFKLVRQKAVLNLPSGVVSISEMKAGSCEKNTMQSIRIEDGPSLIKSVVSYNDKFSFEAKPYDHDLLIPKTELPLLENIARNLSIKNKSNNDILKTVQNYFLSNFTYSLDLKGKGEYKTPLSNFLNNTKSGHCEFFATATALLLRQAKIPTRYVTGYIVHEHSRLENKFIVRQKDAHAWVKVFINGQWQNFDTTPPSFLIEDSKKTESSITEDFISFVIFKLLQFKNETGEKLFKKYGMWLTLPLCLILFFRLKSSKKIRRVSMQTGIQKERPKKEGELSFFVIEKKLSAKGFPRYEYETYVAWIERIGYHFNKKNTKQRLQALLLYHNKNRFNRAGLKKSEQEAFNSGIKNILEEIT